MNAAARVIHQGTLFNGQLAEMQMSKSIYLFFVLLIAVLLSAFAVVYSTNTYRSTFSQLQQEEQQAHFLQLQWGQLLLEQTSLATPARVEDLARGKLKMSFPNAMGTILLHARS